MDLRLATSLAFAVLLSGVACEHTDDTESDRPGDERGVTEVVEPTARIHSRGIEEVHLGMGIGALHDLGGRDTVWLAEGMREQGVAVEVRGGVEVLAVLANGHARRIVTRSPAARTDAGVGVASRLEELREAYGRTCVAVAEGRLVVWFPARPGVSFAVDAPPASNAGAPPDAARVAELWVRDGHDECP